MRLFRGGESQAYIIKPVLFLFVLCFLAVTKLYSNQTRKAIYLLYNWTLDRYYCSTKLFFREDFIRCWLSGPVWLVVAINSIR